MMNISIPSYTVLAPLTAKARLVKMPHLPPSASVRWPADIVWAFLIFQDMGFALQGQAHTLDTRR